MFAKIKYLLNTTPAQRAADKAEYDALEPEYAIMCAIIEARNAVCIFKSASN